MNVKLLVISFLAVFLIGLYFFSMTNAILAARECPEKPCTNSQVKFNEEGSGFVFSGVGGLIAAFAISFLAVAKPNSLPTEGLTLTTDPQARIGKFIEKAIPFAFVLAWLICGALAVYFGLLAEKSIPSLTEMGKGWMGTVIAAVGAFWGIDPKSNQN